jgi:hypothetical protein
MALRANRKCGCVGQVMIRANLLSGVRREAFRGKEHLVAPVIMLRETVVNGALVTVDELKPQGWNGVPVTIGHPQVNGNFVSANAPEVLEGWQIGTIFNTKLLGDKLKGEAWIDIEQAEAAQPGIIEQIEAGGMEVSTGYFSDSTPQRGVFNGKNYTEAHTDLKPDHLALLPDEVGACSFNDGCGVRANKELPMSEKKDAIAVLKEILGITYNERGKDNDYRQMIADLISNDSSPFVPDDEYALREMSYDTLKKMRDAYVELETNSSQGGPEMADEVKPEQTPVANAEAPNETPAYMTAEQVADIVANAVDKAMNAKARSEMIERIHANTEIDKADLEAMSTASLEKLTANAKPAADYSGRGIKTNGDDGAPKFASMVARGVLTVDKEAK